MTAWKRTKSKPHHFEIFAGQCNASNAYKSGELKDPTAADASFRKRLYTFELSSVALEKQKRFLDNCSDKGSTNSILQNLTPDDIRTLIVAEDELNRMKYYRKIFPTNATTKYLQYIHKDDLYYYMLHDSWEAAYGQNRKLGIDRLVRLTKNKIHLKP